MSGFYHYVGAAPLAPSPHYVLLVTPATDHPECAHEKSMVATVETLSRAGIQFDFQLVQGSCHVDDVRNGIIRSFLQWERSGDEPNARKRYTDLFFLDADMGWDAKSILDLLQAPGDIVAGVYRHKHDNETYPFEAGPFEGLGVNEAQLFEMPKVATGFMRIRRAVIEKLYEVEKAGGLIKSDTARIYWPSPQDRQINDIGVARIVERGWPRELGIPIDVHPGNDYQSGDYVLCLKARAAGFRVFVDPDMRFSHTGKKVWIGHFGNHLRQQQSVLPKGFGEAVEALRKGDATPEAFQALFDGWDLHSGRSPMGNPWTMEADALAELYRQARAATRPVLEMGSGLTTLVIGLALDDTGQALHALECDLDSFRKTAAALDRFDIRNVVMHYAPLMPIGGKPDDVAYGEADIPADFGLVLVDGPYSSAQRTSALWALRDKIRTATLVIDDVNTSGPLIEMLQKAGHSIDIRKGAIKRWAVAKPPARAVGPMQHTLPGKLVVSLTSHPPRYGMLKHALQSILDQDMRPDETVLWLARHEFAELPSDILRMDGLTIRQCEDIRSYKKLIPALREYPGAFVLTADDDLVYPRTWVRSFCDAYRSDREIMLRRGRRIGTHEDGALSPYNRWPIAHPNEPGPVGAFPTSCHGMLVPPGSMHPEVMDMDKAQLLAPMNDDIWWYWMGLRGGSTFRVIDGDPIHDLPTGADGLWSQHNRDGGNDRQIAAMLEAYGLPWAPAASEAAE